MQTKKLTKEDVSIVKEALKIFKDKERLEAVKKFIKLNA